jgi:hypothetical protein
VVAPKGFRGTGMYAGMRAAAKGDVALVVCDEGAVAAGTFTQNVVCAAPVTVCKQVLSRNSGAIRAVRSFRRTSPECTWPHHRLACKRAMHSRSHLLRLNVLHRV